MTRKGRPPKSTLGQGNSYDRTRERTLTRDEKKAGWEITTCIKCRGKGEYHFKTCGLCNGTGRIKTLK